MSSTSGRNIICVQMSAEDQIVLDKAAGTYDENVQADPKYYLQLGDFQTIPVGMDDNPERYVELLVQAVPEANTLRLCFNEYSFNPDGSLHPLFERFLIAAANAGLEFIIGVTGQNAQQLGDDGSLSVAEMRNGLVNEVFPAMSGAWDKMLDWLENHPDVAAAIYGLELVNEPAAYARAESMAEDTGEFVRMYADHMLALADIVQARMDTRILVGGWGYSGSFEIFAGTTYGNSTVLDVIRQGVGDALIWSAHLYPSWVSGNIQTVDLLDGVYEGLYGVLGDDDVIMTETNAAGDQVNDYTARDTSFDMTRSYELLADRGIGIGWFQGLEAGASNLAVIDAGGSGGVRYLHPNSLAHALNGYSLDEIDPALAGDNRLTAELLPGRVRNDVTLEFMDVDGIGTAFGRDGNDILTGLSHAVNMLYGGRGNDKLLGMEANDYLFGQDGSDSLQGQLGDDILMGGDGSDTLVADFGSDTLTGGTGADVFRIGEGYQVITDYSDQEYDRLYIGQDQILSTELQATGIMQDIDHDGFADDLLLNRGAVTLALINYRNIIPDGVVSGSDGADLIDTEYVDFQGEKVDWRGANIKAGAGNDSVSGGMGNDVIYGETGNDSLSGRGGDDRLFGGGNDDTLSGGGGVDSMYGGTGNDTYLIDDSLGRAVEASNAGIDVVQASVSYTLTAEVESLVLTGGTDIRGIGNSMNNDVLGSFGSNVLLGGGGNDTISGRGGDDTIKGGIGNDMMHGGQGADRLVGGLGTDRMTGAEGADLFVFNALAESTFGEAGPDVIADFRYWQGDRIDLNVIDARADIAGNQSFKFIGTSAFSGTAGELHVKVANGGTLISADVNGDRVSDFSLYLIGELVLTADAFLL